MYGIVNKSIEELIINHYGQQDWDAIRKKSGITVDFFLTNEAYDDSITYQLAMSAAEHLQITVSDVLVLFGEWWILHTCNLKYGAMMASGGSNLKEFLLHLPRFHDRAQLMYPKLAPPEFKVEEIRPGTMHVHYISHRPGLQEFVRGLLQGLAKLYETQVEIQLLTGRSQGSSHEIFEIIWK